MTKFEIPERWVVKVINSEQDAVIVPYINETFGTRIEIGLSQSTTPWFYSNQLNKNTKDDNKHDDSYAESFEYCVEISFDDFVKYIINKYPIEFKHDPLLETIYKRLLT